MVSADEETENCFINRERKRKQIKNETAVALSKHGWKQINGSDKRRKEKVKTHQKHEEHKKVDKRLKKAMFKKKKKKKNHTKYRHKHFLNH